MEAFVMSNYSAKSGVDALCVDFNGLGGGTDNRVLLVAVPFVPVPALGINFGDCQPTWPGYEPILMGIGAAFQIHDSSTGRRGIRMPETSAPYLWVLDDDINPPQTIYGFAIWNTDREEWIGSMLFDAPRLMSKKGDFVELRSLLGYFDAGIFQRDM